VRPAVVHPFDRGPRPLGVSRCERDWFLGSGLRALGWAGDVTPERAICSMAEFTGSADKAKTSPDLYRSVVMARRAIPFFLALVVSLGTTTIGCDASKRPVSHAPPVTTGLRGVRLPRLSCSLRPKASETRVVAIGTVEEFLLCRWGLRGVPRSPLIVKPSDRNFTLLSSALAAPNVPTTTEPCLVLSELEIVLLARTPAGAFRISVPQDGCGLYQQSAVDAIYGAPGDSGA
jgi:hypothetical protein